MFCEYVRHVERFILNLIIVSLWISLASSICEDIVQPSKKLHNVMKKQAVGTKILKNI